MTSSKRKLEVIMIGFMILGGIVSSRLKGKIKKYSQVPTVSGMSGKEIAERMLNDNGIFRLENLDFHENAHGIHPNRMMLILIHFLLVQKQENHLIKSLERHFYHKFQ